MLDVARRSDAAVYAIALRSERASERDRLMLGRATFFLGTLARETGGQVYAARSLGELGKVYERIAGELRSQYALGYVSNRPPADGAWRTISVSVTGREDLRVRHKPGYFTGGGAGTGTHRAP